VMCFNSFLKDTRMGWDRKHCAEKTFETREGCLVEYCERNTSTKVVSCWLVESRCHPISKTTKRPAVPPELSAHQPPAIFGKSGRNHQL